jgi:hypothetical protein
MKVFKMNDYDWVAANSAKEAKEWYIKEFENDYDSEEFEEVSLDMILWCNYEEENYNEIRQQLEGSNEPVKINNNTFLLSDGVKIQKTLKDLDVEHLDEPYIIASSDFKY